MVVTGSAAQFGGCRIPRAPLDPCNPEAGNGLEINGNGMPLFLQLEENGHGPHQSPAISCIVNSYCIDSLQLGGSTTSGLQKELAPSPGPAFNLPDFVPNNQLFDCGMFVVFIQGDENYQPGFLRYGIHHCSAMPAPGRAFCPAAPNGTSVAGAELPAGPFVANGAYYNIVVTDNGTGSPITTLPARVMIPLEQPYFEPLQVFLYNEGTALWEQLSDYAVNDVVVTIEAPRLGIFAVVSSPAPAVQTVDEAEATEVVSEEIAPQAELTPADDAGLPALLPGGQFVRYEGGEASASALFSDAKITWLWDEGNGGWLAYIPLLGIGDFALHSGSLLWVTTYDSYERGTPVA